MSDSASGRTVDFGDVRLDDVSKSVAIVTAIRESEFEDTTSREIQDATELTRNELRPRLRRLVENDVVEVTRDAGPAKLYRVVEDTE